jgi:uncharacterized protein YydD (DUF2326 family)
MKGFIEVTYKGEAKYTININQIIWFCTYALNGGKTTLILHDGTRFIADESYDEVKELIAKAVQQ